MKVSVKQVARRSRLGLFRAFVFLGLGVCLGGVSWHLYADDSVPQASSEAIKASPVEARDLLQRMAQSQRQLSYTGLFTYEHGGALESFRIEHWQFDGVEYERLTNLAGPQAAIVRKGRRLSCAQPGSKLLYSRLSELGELNSAGDKLDDLSRFYRLSVDGRTRVANRSAIRLRVMPRHPDRYGLTLVLDEQTGLLLKAMLVDLDGRAVERFQFLQLSLGADSAMLTSNLTSNLTELPEDLSCPEQASQGDWALEWLPRGFVASGVRQSAEGEQMLSFTDGLTSFSVFIAPESQAGWPMASVRRGATSVYMGALVSKGQRYRVTVVGELPMATAERLSKSVYPTGVAG